MMVSWMLCLTRGAGCEMAGALGGLYLLYVCRVLVYSRDLFFLVAVRGCCFQLAGFQGTYASTICLRM